MGLTRLRASNILDSDYKNSCRVTTTTNVTLSGGAPSTVDGISLAVDDRVLVQGQSTASQNGIYRVSVLGTGSDGTWVRAADANQPYSVSAGEITYIESGTANGSKFFYVTTTGNVILDTTSISFTQLPSSISGPNGAVQFSDAGTLSGTTYLQYNKTSGNLVSNSTTTSTSTTTGALVLSGGAGIGGNLYVGGAGTFTGNVLPSANVTYSLGSTTRRWSNLWLSGTTIWLGSIALSDNNGSLSVYDSTGTALANFTTASINNTPIGNATPSTGVFTTLTATSGYQGATSGAHNGTLGATTPNTVVATSITTTSGGQITGYLTGAIGANTANTGSFTTVVTSGDVTVGGNLTVGGTTTSVNSTIVNINDINIVLANNAATAAAADGAGITVNGAGATITYTNATTSWNFNKAIIGPSLTTTSGGQVTGYMTGPIGANAANTGAFTTISASSTLAVSGTANFAGTLNAATVQASTIGNSGATLTGTLSTASQTNITAVGTLGSLAVTSGVTAGSITTTGGGQLTGYHTGAIGANTANTGVFTSVTTVSGGQVTGYMTGPIGANTANTGAFTTITASSTLNVTGTANFAGTVTAATINAATIGNSGATLTGTLQTAAQTNITSVGTLGSLAVTGNITAGNLQINGTGTVVATGFYGNHYWANGTNATISYTASSAAPTAQRNGDQWYDTTNDILYTRINDGTTSYWLDISSVPNSFSNLVATVANIATLNITGNLTFSNTAQAVTVSGNITAGNIVSTNGGLYASNYYYANGVPFTGGAGGTPGGSQNQLQFNDAFAFTGTTYLLYMKANGNLYSSSTTSSTSKTTGGIVAAGGIGVAGNVFANAIYSDNHFFANGTTITTPAGGSNTQIQYNNSGSFAGASGVTTNGANLTATGGLQNTPIGNSVASTATFTVITVTQPSKFNDTVNMNGITAVTLNAGTVGNAGALVYGTLQNAAQTNITSVGTLSSLTSGTITPSSNNAVNIGSTSGYWANIYGTNIYQNGTRLSKFTTSASAPSSNVVGDFWYKSGSDILYQYVNDGTNSFFLDLTTKPSQYANLSITSNLYVSGTVSSSIIPAANTSLNLGSATANWGTVYAVTLSGTATTAKYADLAENYLSDEHLDPGDVVIFGGRKEITISYRYADTRLAGVISTDPAYLMNSDLEDSYPVALTGRVPCKVLGPVLKGDVLVSSDLVGVAQALRSDSDFRPGCILGKSLEDHPNNTIKTIEVVVGRY